MTGYSVYNGNGELVSNWTTRKNAIAAGVEMTKRGEVGHYVVNEKNAQLVWSA